MVKGIAAGTNSIPYRIILLDIELSARAASDARPCISKLGLKIGKKVEKGVETIVQDDRDKYNPSDYKLPAPSKTGPTLSESSLKNHLSFLISSYYKEINYRC